MIETFVGVLSHMDRDCGLEACGHLAVVNTNGGITPLRELFLPLEEWIPERCAKDLCLCQICPEAVQHCVACSDAYDRDFFCQGDGHLCIACCTHPACDAAWKQRAGLKQ